MSDAGIQPPPVEPPPAPAWFAGLDDVTKGTIQNTGLDKLEPVAAVAKAVQMFRDTQSKLGIPADRVLRIPEASDEAGWKTVHQRLGVPETPDGYDFSAVKAADGAALADDMVAFLRSTAAALAIPKDRAPKLAEALLKRDADGAATDASAAAVQNGAARLRLQQNWGPNAPNNKFVADRTAAMLGLPAEILGEFEKSPQYDVIMEGLRAAGERMGEAQLIGGVGGGGNAKVMTREGALARIEERKKDTAWFARWRAGDAAAVAEWNDLIQMAAPAR